MTLQAFLQNVRTQQEILKELQLYPIMQRFEQLPWANAILQSQFERAVIGVSKLELLTEEITTRLQGIIDQIPMLLFFNIAAITAPEIFAWTKGNWPWGKGVPQHYRDKVESSLQISFDGISEITLDWSRDGVVNTSGRNYAMMEHPTSVEARTHIWARSQVAFAQILEQSITQAVGALS